VVIFLVVLGGGAPWAGGGVFYGGGVLFFGGVVFSCVYERRSRLRPVLPVQAPSGLCRDSSESLSPIFCHQLERPSKRLHSLGPAPTPMETSAR